MLSKERLWIKPHSFFFSERGMEMRTLDITYHLYVGDGIIESHTIRCEVSKKANNPIIGATGKALLNAYYGKKVIDKKHWFVYEEVKKNG